MDTNLTRCELQILELMKRGDSNPAIAACLYRSIKTIENHVRSILQKLQAKNRTDAVVKGLMLGVIKLDQEEHRDDA